MNRNERIYFWSLMAVAGAIGALLGSVGVPPLIPFFIGLAIGYYGRRLMPDWARR